MLILSRKIHERVIIDDEVSIVALGIKGNQVRLGIVAPSEPLVHREEIYNQIQTQYTSLKERMAPLVCD